MILMTFLRLIGAILFYDAKSKQSVTQGTAQAAEYMRALGINNLNLEASNNGNKAAYGHTPKSDSLFSIAYMQNPQTWASITGCQISFGGNEKSRPNVSSLS